MLPNSPALHYQAYQAVADLTTPMRGAARFLAPWLHHSLFWWPHSRTLRKAAAACEVLALSGLTHHRPPFNIDTVDTPAGTCTVSEEVVFNTPFCSLLRFRKTPSAGTEPKVLLVAPVSGHFATLLRGTVQTLLQDHDVYVTDWHNVRDIPLSEGAFDLDTFIEHIIRFVDWLGPHTHLVAVCQPTVPTLAAVAVMAEDKHPHQPRSMTLMAGPIDCRINPTEVNNLATAKPMEWFESKLIGVVPLRYKGALRRVYPGFPRSSQAFWPSPLGLQQLILPLPFLGSLVEPGLPQVEGIQVHSLQHRHRSDAMRHDKDEILATDPLGPPLSE